MITIGTILTLRFMTRDATSGQLTDADSLPTTAVYEDANDTPILSPVPVNYGTGLYRVSVDTAAANGFDVGSGYSVLVTAAVGGFEDTTVLATFVIEDVITQPVSGTAAINTRVVDGTVHTGDEGATTFTNTRQADGILHTITDDGGAIDVEYEFQIGASTTPTSLTMSANLNGAAGSSLAIKAYNWQTLEWGQVGNIPRTGGSSLAEYNAPLFSAHVGTGVDEGRVLIRLSDGVGNKTLLDVDLIYVSYAVRTPTLDEIANAVLDDVTEGSLTVRQSWRLVLAALVGQARGAPNGPIVFSGINGGRDRITATVDAHGNRISIVYDADA